MKSEPDVFSIDDLEREGSTHWDGVRNYQARNFMRDDMQVGDLVLFYHSNATPPGVAGVAEVCKPGYPDFTAWDPKDSHFDPKSSPDNPRWMMVDIQFVEKFPSVVSLQRLKEHEETLDGMYVIKRGMRLSVQPVEKQHFDAVLKLGRSGEL
ncbi:MAG: EVE domain-containing protein [Myxococcales bacterium]|nr:EVE domain-containing protein [Myxococcales bacterium]